MLFWSFLTSSQLLLYQLTDIYELSYKKLMKANNSCIISKVLEIRFLGPQSGKYNRPIKEWANEENYIWADISS